jgi:S-phase kinase-associated protein 1
MAAAEAEPMVQLVAKDEVRLDMPLAHTSQSLLLRELLDDAPEGETPEVPIPIVDGATLKYVVEYAALRHKNPPREIERPLNSSLFSVIDELDKKFVTPMDEATVQRVLVAANFLNYPTLKALMCARCAEWMKEKNVDEIRAMFGIVNDFTPEEIAALRKEHGLDSGAAQA